MSFDEQEQFIKRSPLCAGDKKAFDRDYIFQKRLGKGGFGSVFKAYDIRNKCFVAYKIMPLT